MYSLDDTIAAISTPIGEGGIGIVRLTGSDAPSILHRLFVPAHNPVSLSRLPRTLHYGHIVDPVTGDRVDEVLAVHLPAPHTYTRQDVVEINGHGGIVALTRVQSLCLREGARLAEPGEFTARAFLNGRLDLAQAEAVLDVIQAKTETSLRAAVAQLDGSLSDQVRAVRATLVEALAYLEASIDFVDDEIPERDIGPDLQQAAQSLIQLLADADRGIIYRQGVRAAIVGRPNVGKSSLLNRLLRVNRAIVTDIPGTTRDTLEETLNLKGIPLVLVDTAGIAALTMDPIERLGIERSRAALAKADLVLLVLDASEPLMDADRSIVDLVHGKPTIVILNKVDLLGGAAPVAQVPNIDAPARSVVLSALTGEGLDSLQEAILETILAGQVTTTGAPKVTNPRHKEALHRALDSVEATRVASSGGLPAELVAIDLSAAVNDLGEITGQSASADLIETIFSTFCVGK
jgi:tRNA modification GTPase